MLFRSPRTASRTIVWREADTSINGATRNELSPATTLIIWTVPPGASEWQTALDAVEPRRLILFGQMPPEFTVTSFLQRLAGLAKFTIKQKGGVVTLSALAAALAQRATTVRYGLLWLQQAGKLGVTLGKNESVEFTETPIANPTQDLASLEKLIQSALAETLAYRKEWLSKSGAGFSL